MTEARYKVGDMIRTLRGAMDNYGRVVDVWEVGRIAHVPPNKVYAVNLLKYDHIIYCNEKELSPLRREDIARQMAMTH